MNPVWTERNTFLIDYELQNKSVIDFGCGDKSVCNYINFKSYVGYDINPLADYKVDFNKKFTIKHTAEVGLVLGVLEYLDEPEQFLQTIQPTCDRFVIMALNTKAPKISRGWKQVYNENTLFILLNKHFSTVKIAKINKYILANCYK
jgi:hypothetical protein